MQNIKLNTEILLQSEGYQTKIEEVEGNYEFIKRYGFYLPRL
ncbi:hypothetical protein CPK_ORF00056 [Chlamydia pneumoniae LPCoLN]|uniref:Uncharacterized protein n=1 Tax=Chlamydia pneumoniae TaxID=83558 RepID=A0A0F7WT89_CHLPN|nr:hypothetical protein CPK_ORF00056 [Chlamydia pneumoniae LPCoLN]CRI42776.1 Uncharacterized protein BN1224_DC9_BU_01010 [Chlamydia pneumoniae]CRI43911.1 Uncharacterized protein BN1224_H12_EK_00500 [Chlamydia pneumoniae]CRI53389.1 Uncharacterized protein BN1224_Wien2_G_03090 [Chlamydia pneumoniae]CRI73323.1 Uncharacterized protein BN1224_YK41_BR_01000 [Chlamydia pneumoniae]